MKTLEVITKYGTRYTIDEDGCFLKYNENKWEHPHDSWKCTGIAKLRPFGNMTQLSLKTFFEMAANKQTFTFKNGNPRYTLTDLDHGTHRIHGNTKCHGISSAWINN
jgi:hypothetical protein